MIRFSSPLIYPAPLHPSAEMPMAEGLFSVQTVCTLRCTLGGHCSLRRVQRVRRVQSVSAHLNNNNIIHLHSKGADRGYSRGWPHSSARRSLITSNAFYLFDSELPGSPLRRTAARPPGSQVLLGRKVIPARNTGRAVFSEIDLNSTGSAPALVNARRHRRLTVKGRSGVPEHRKLTRSEWPFAAPPGGSALRSDRNRF